MIPVAVTTSSWSPVSKIRNRCQWGGYGVYVEVEAEVENWVTWGRITGEVSEATWLGFRLGEMALFLFSTIHTVPSSPSQFHTASNI